MEFPDIWSCQQSRDNQISLRFVREFDMDSRICQNCSAPIQEDDSFCILCGHEIDSEGTKRPYKSKGSESNGKDWGWNCKMCGRFNVSTVICKGCGMSIDGDARKPETDSPKKDSPEKMRGFACYSPNCTNAVIGQCMGFDDTCGRFYCHTHSDEKLCVACAETKLSHDAFELYCKKAEELYKYTRWGFTPNLVSLAGLLLGILICSLTTDNLIVGILFGGFAATLIIAPISHFYNIAYEHRTTRELSGRMPEFDSFYRAWKKEKKKQEILMAGGIAFGILLSVIENEFQMMRLRSMLNDVAREQG